MLKVLYVVNRVSKTSIPLQWKESCDGNVDIIGLNKFYLFLSAIISKHDILHGHHIKSSFVMILINCFLRKKVVFTMHGSYKYLSNLNKIFLVFIFKASDHVVFVNQCLYDELPVRIKYMLSNKYKVILNGVETKINYNLSDVLKKYKISNQEVVIFHPARFVPEKNHLMLINSFFLLSKEIENVRLVLAGDGILKNEMEEKIQELGIENQVSILGTISKDEVYSFLHECRVFVMISLSEGLNIAFLEAMSMKCRIVVSNIEQFTYPFEHYNINPKDYNVYFTNPSNVNSMTKILKQSINSSREQKFDFTKFSIHNMLLSYDNIYKKITNAKG
jgi:glycosyltransferase involved in cell wall biosynthesis